MVAGLLEPDAGESASADEDVTWRPPHRRNIGLVFQSYALFPHMSVFENVAFGLRRRRVDEAAIRARVGEALEMVRLGRARAPAAARAVRRPAAARRAGPRHRALSPALLLLDEPLSNLDAKLRDTMRFELRRLQQELSITTLFVTHDQEEALTMSDRICRAVAAACFSRSASAARRSTTTRRPPSSPSSSAARTLSTGRWSRTGDERRRRLGRRRAFNCRRRACRGPRGRRPGPRHDPAGERRASSEADGRRGARPARDDGAGLLRRVDGAVRRPAAGRHRAERRDAHRPRPQPARGWPHRAGRDRPRGRHRDAGDR